jgi:hypothetical protein
LTPLFVITEYFMPSSFRIYSSSAAAAAATAAAATATATASSSSALLTVVVGTQRHAIVEQS